MKAKESREKIEGVELKEDFFEQCRQATGQHPESNVEFTWIRFALVPEFVVVALAGREFVRAQCLHMLAFVTHAIIDPDFGSGSVKEVKLNVARIGNLIAKLDGVSADQWLLEMQSDFRRSLRNAILVIATAWERPSRNRPSDQYGNDEMHTLSKYPNFTGLFKA